MAYNCKILLDSISPTGKRLTTFELTYPRIIHSEFMTHRMFSRNAASSRAIPSKRMREMVVNETFVPDRFPKNVTGMQPTGYIENDGTDSYNYPKQEWLRAARYAAEQHARLESLGIHKQICNRLLEPFLWYTCIVTATEFSNFFKLRTHPDAQYEIRRIADLMYEAYHNNYCYNNRFNQCDRVHSHPQKLKVGEWHCPLVYEEDNDAIIKAVDDFFRGNSKTNEVFNGATNIAIDSAFNDVKKAVSVARCARVSYLTHDGKRDIEKDLELFERLQTSGHWSPFEHVATPYCHEGLLWQINKKIKETGEQYIFPPDINLKSGNFIGWKQYRKEFPNENCTNFRKE